MSEEEKKAIERIKSELDINEFMPRLVFRCEDVEKALNLIEKQQNELEQVKERYKDLNWYFENQKNNYISKDKIKAEMEDIIDYFEYANAPSEDIEFLEKKKKEILEEK